MYALDRRSCFQCATTQVALPSGVRGPELSLPCSRHLVLLSIGCFWQSPPDLVLARQSLVSFCAVSFVLIIALAFAPSLSVYAWAFVSANQLKTCVRVGKGPQRFGKIWLPLKIFVKQTVGRNVGRKSVDID